ncbi:DUF1800 domain-containing protein [Vibrio sp. SCSIO 43137]|uniref:DUF1800 domain-containing protein n=1 Tax=Vibrio sp. SCSIO 43137 TaxID=3021011 RepID=UPI002307F67C|nr:DUF1800 family protein [Vibrio sp. SCSIO 43137]WCE32595.1 DUF1800 family protein [Vibrio sp. SCSIO 43137]
MKDNSDKVSRFLMQATLGANRATIDRVTDTGIEPWLESELNSVPDRNDSYQSLTASIWQSFRTKLVAKHGEKEINGEGNNPALPYKWYFHMAWWQNALQDNEHLLRKRVAQALSEILVISDNSVLELDSVGLASYYDLLYNHAFGSYTDLLYQVSLHPCMGVYLSHMNNRKADKSRNIHPDENYAREIMQLFTIGLYQLNPDGSRKKDANGDDIASYNNHDIKQLARVFTGLHADSYQYEWTTSFWNPSYNGYQVSFDDGIDKTYKTVPFVDMTRPMQIEERYHDRESKSLLNGHISLPANRDGAGEIRETVAKLVSHPNTAPFIATKLINQLVTSNPSKEYVATVAAKFGQHGDLKAVIREILTYPLRNPVANKRFINAYRQDNKLVQSQKLKSPLLRVTQLLRAFEAKNASGKYWLIGDDIQDQLSQHPLSSPTVFNFYKPDFAPHGPIEQSKLLAPEFELHNSATSIAYVNLMYYWFFGHYLPAVSTEISHQPGIFNVAELRVDQLQNKIQDKLNFDYSPYLPKAQQTSRHDELIDEISLLLTGKPSLEIKPLIKESYKPYQDNAEWVVQTIAFLIAISAEFAVQEA